MNNYTAKQLFFGGLLAPIALGLVIGGIALATQLSFGGAEEQHIAGNKNATVKIVEYSDFQCPFCERAYPSIKQIIAEYGDRVSLEFKHYPLDFHQYAQKAAEASECAAEQGKFWDFHDYAFEHQDSLSFENLKVWARAIGLKGAAFDSCLDSGKYASQVAADYKEGQDLGVSGTPTTFINGKAVVGAQPYAAFKQAIDEALK